MIPLFTTKQLSNGIDHTDYKIDLGDYMKKTDAKSLATKAQLDSLSEAVAGKLDANPIHTHTIGQITDLQNVLTSKFDKSEKYSHKLILNDIETIEYLAAPKIEILEVVKDKDSSGYKFYVDDSSGDLIISLNNVQIGYYSKSSSNWTFSGFSTGSLVDGQKLLTDISTNATNITNLSSRVSTAETNISQSSASVQAAVNTADGLKSQLEEYIAKTDAIIKNHYDVLLLLCKEHHLIDTDNTDGDKITPGDETE